MVLWIKSVADGNASLGFPKGICILVLYLKIQFELVVEVNRRNSDLEKKTRRFTLV